MSHFAKINSEGQVLDVIVAEQDYIDWRAETQQDPENFEWIKTSFNVKGGVYYIQQEDGSLVAAEDQAAYINDDYPERKRKNFACIGGTYDAVEDAFYCIPPYNNWVKDTSTATWVAPTAMPDDGEDYAWNEVDAVWEQMTENNPAI
jgi:hypothetical protein